VSERWAELYERYDGNLPVAVELATAAELLNVPLAQVQAAAAGLEPFLCADGATRKWSLAGLALALGLAHRNRKGTGVADPMLAFDAVAPGTMRRSRPRLRRRRVRPPDGAAAEVDRPAPPSEPVPLPSPRSGLLAGERLG
jgi:hypothetical protein